MSAPIERVEERYQLSEEMQTSLGPEVSSVDGAETEESEDRLERSAVVLSALRNDTSMIGDVEEEEEITEEYLKQLPSAVVGQDPHMLCNKERVMTRWEVPTAGEIVDGIEGRDWVYNYLKLLETGDYEKLVPSGRKKVTPPGSREAFINLLCEENAITPGRALMSCQNAFVVRFPIPPATMWRIDAPRT
jgi:hypothetical protein